LYALALGLLVIVVTLQMSSDDDQPPDVVTQVALATASEQLGVPTDALVVTAAVQQTWPDSSLGCPQPGLAYSQVVTPGWLITVDTVDGAAEVEVHTDRGSRGVIC
jgi:hypothetical protein